MFRNHSGFLAGAVVALVTSFVLFVGCAPKTTSVRDPSKKVDAAGLAVEAAAAKSDLDTEAADVQRRASEYNAHVTAANAKFGAASADLRHKAEVQQSLFTALGAAIPQLLSGQAFTPAGAVGTVLTLLGVFGGAGALTDSAAKQNQLNKQRAASSGDGAAPMSTSDPVVIAEPLKLTAATAPTLPGSVNDPKAA
jgi:hypothetical protein